jgi:hypothetical protein
MSPEKTLTTSDIAAAPDREARERQARDRTDAHAAGTPIALGPAGTDVREPRPDMPRSVDDTRAPLFVEEEAGGFRTRWSAIQTGFVDEPRKAVEQADSLVAEVMQRLAQEFAEKRRQLEAQWERTDQISTEDLRLAMRTYRSFFERLLAI